MGIQDIHAALAANGQGSAGAHLQIAGKESIHLQGDAVRNHQGSVIDIDILIAADAEIPVKDHVAEEFTVDLAPFVLRGRSQDLIQLLNTVHPNACSQLGSADSDHILRAAVDHTVTGIGAAGANLQSAALGNIDIVVVYQFAGYREGSLYTQAALNRQGHAGGNRQGHAVLHAQIALGDLQIPGQGDILQHINRLRVGRLILQFLQRRFQLLQSGHKDTGVGVSGLIACEAAFVEQTGIVVQVYRALIVQCAALLNPDPAVFRDQQISVIGQGHSIGNHQFGTALNTEPRFLGNRQIPGQGDAGLVFQINGDTAVACDGKGLPQLLLGVDEGFVGYQRGIDTGNLIQGTRQITISSVGAARFYSQAAAFIDADAVDVGQSRTGLHSETARDTQPGIHRQDDAGGNRNAAAFLDEVAGIPGKGQVLGNVEGIRNIDKDQFRTLFRLGNGRLQFCQGTNLYTGVAEEAGSVAKILASVLLEQSTFLTQTHGAPIVQGAAGQEPHLSSVVDMNASLVHKGYSIANHQDTVGLHMECGIGGNHQIPFQGNLVMKEKVQFAIAFHRQRFPELFVRGYGSAVADQGAVDSDDPIQGAAQISCAGIAASGNHSERAAAENLNRMTIVQGCGLHHAEIARNTHPGRHRQGAARTNRHGAVIFDIHINIRLTSNIQALGDFDISDNADLQIITGLACPGHGFLQFLKGGHIVGGGFPLGQGALVVQGTAVIGQRSQVHQRAAGFNPEDGIAVQDNLAVVGHGDARGNHQLAIRRFQNLALDRQLGVGGNGDVMGQGQGAVHGRRVHGMELGAGCQRIVQQVHAVGQAVYGNQLGGNPGQLRILHLLTNQDRSGNHIQRDTLFHKGLAGIRQVEAASLRDDQRTAGAEHACGKEASLHAHTHTRGYSHNVVPKIYLCTPRDCQILRQGQLRALQGDVQGLIVFRSGQQAVQLLLTGRVNPIGNLGCVNAGDVGAVALKRSAAGIGAAGGDFQTAGVIDPEHALVVQAALHKQAAVNIQGGGRGQAQTGPGIHRQGEALLDFQHTLLQLQAAGNMDIRFHTDPVLGGAVLVQSLHGIAKLLGGGHMVDRLIAVGLLAQVGTLAHQAVFTVLSQIAPVVEGAACLDAQGGFGEQIDSALVYQSDSIGNHQGGAGVQEYTHPAFGDGQVLGQGDGAPGIDLNGTVAGDGQGGAKGLLRGHIALVDYPGAVHAGNAVQRTRQHTGSIIGSAGGNLQSAPGIHEQGALVQQGTPVLYQERSIDIHEGIYGEGRSGPDGDGIAAVQNQMTERPLGVGAESHILGDDQVRRHMDVRPGFRLLRLGNGGQQLLRGGDGIPVRGARGHRGIALQGAVHGQAAVTGNGAVVS